MEELAEKLATIVGGDNLLLNEMMSGHTTFKIGGPADYFVTPENVNQIVDVINIANEYNVSYAIIGNGSNIIVPDEGYRGIVILLYDKFNSMEFQAHGDGIWHITVEAGAMLGRIGNEFMKRSLTGFEFATGIPGTVGGAVVMNAGAYGGEIKDIIVNATVLTRENKIMVLSKGELELGYRTSIVPKKGYIVLSAEFELREGNAEEISDKVRDLAMRRREKQPLEYPSAGSTFKRPEGYFAGKLIADAGLKGFHIGGIEVSEKHAGFVINKGKGTATEFFSLIDYVCSKVYEQFVVELELEVKILR